MDIGVHTLDLVLWLMGNPEPRAVSAINNFRRPGGSYVNPPAWGDRDLGQMDVEQYSAGFVRIADDVSLSLEASWVGHLPDDEAYPQLILGDRGGARITPFGSATPVEMFTRDGVVSSRTVPEAFPETVAHTEQIRNWCAALRGEEELVVEPWQCVDVMRIIDGFYESSGVGAEVRLARRSPRQTLVNGAGGESRV